MTIMDLVAALAPEAQVKEVGIRPGEKLHEVLISQDEARNALELDDLFIIRPTHSWWDSDRWSSASPVALPFTYGSDTNSQWLSREELAELVSAL
jgi:UDP-N-acetylglucosamine 4,6-dehydratase